MKFLFLSIVSCLFVSHINYASEKPNKPAWKYTFPVLTKLGIIKKSQPNDIPNCIIKNLSEGTITKLDETCDWDKNDTDATTPTTTTHSPISTLQNSIKSQDSKETQDNWVVYDESKKPVTQFMEIQRDSDSSISAAEANGQLTLKDIFCCCSKKKTNK